jgi:hypothetical protein
MVEKNGTNNPSGFNPPSSAELVPFDLPPDGGLTAWLVVLACFLLNFNILGILYSFGRRILSCFIFRSQALNVIGIYQAHYLLHQFPDDSAEVSILSKN